MGKFIKSQRGFSLIELMIVVAIIGILSAIAVPNFQRFQAKSRQSEAKGNLSGYFTAQKAAYQETSFFPGEFVAAGFNPDGVLNYRIIAVDFTANPQYGANDNTCISTIMGCNYGAVATQLWVENAIATVTSGPGPSATAAAIGATTFLATASGKIGTTAVDTWTINEMKTLLNPVDGLP